MADIARISQELRALNKCPLPATENQVKDLVLGGGAGPAAGSEGQNGGGGRAVGGQGGAADRGVPGEEQPAH